MLGNFMYAAYLLSRCEEYMGCINAKDFLEFLESNKYKIITGLYIVKYNNEYKFVIDDNKEPYDFNDKEIIEELYSYKEWVGIKNK